jgi:hypothetical protein
MNRLKIPQCTMKSTLLLIDKIKEQNDISSKIDHWNSLTAYVCVNYPRQYHLHYTDINNENKEITAKKIKEACDNFIYYSNKHIILRHFPPYPNEEINLNIKCNLLITFYTIHVCCLIYFLFTYQK